MGATIMNTTETPEQAARRLAANALRSGYEWQALHEYTSANGDPLYWRIRMKNPAGGEKWIRPLSVANGQFSLKEPAFADGKPLYRLHELAAQPNQSVWVVEGEWCADHLADLGLLATTSGAADSAAQACWQPLAGRTVNLWSDNDESGERFAAAVAQALAGLGCQLQRVVIDKLGLPIKGDAVDWLALHPGATAADVQALPLRPVEMPVTDAVPADEPDKSSLSSQIVAFVAEHAALFRDSGGQVYAQARQTGEVRRIEGSAFRDWLLASFYEATGRVARDQAVREALSTLSGRARIHGECHPVHIRVAGHAGDYYLDLAIAGSNKVVKISAGQWDLVDDAPVMFVRPNTMRPLPEPERGGNLDELWEIANIPPDCQLLVLAWLCECLRPDTPFPILELIGEQGSAKSTTQSILRQLIDPNACDLRAAPKVVEDMYVTAANNWLVSYENLSHLSAPMQDALCILSTGGGYARRKLYSDADESVITVKRPVALNGISVTVTAQDLVDRTLSMDLPTITHRREVTELGARFSANHGRLLGAMLDVLAGALRHLPAVELPAGDRPRLLEFARLGVAIENYLQLPLGSFMREFNLRRQEAIGRTIDASPVASAVVEWIGQNPAGGTMPVKDWLCTLELKRPSHCDAWPRSPKGLGDALRRAASALRQLGIECRALPKLGGVIRWEIKPREKLSKPSPASLACHAERAAGQDMEDIQDMDPVNIFRMEGSASA
jgi:hypothetical protein